MEQKVKLQFSCDVEDVPKFCGISLAEAVYNLSKVSNLITSTMTSLSEVTDGDLDKLKENLKSLENLRINLLKIDNRVADVSSMIAGLINFKENPSPPPGDKEEPLSRQEGDIDDNISSR